MKPEIVALVPMRHQSERVPGKNFRLCAGRPLFAYILETLESCEQIDRIAVDTDSPAIKDRLREHFPSVHIIDRPVHLQDGRTPMNEVLLHDTAEVGADFYLQTHSTNPLLQPETIDKAIQTLLSNTPAYDSLFSVTRMQTRFWDALARPINHNPEILLRTQDLPPVYEENSCLYMFTRDILAGRRNRIGARPYMFEIDAAEAWDIDEELDFEIVSWILENRS